MSNAAGILSPLANPTAYDVVVVGGVTSPGVCFLSGFKRIQGFDKKIGKGTIGVTPTMTTSPPCYGHIKFVLWDDGVASKTGVNQFANMGPFLAQLKYDPTKQNIKAIDVYHPSLAAIDAVAFVCEELGALEQEGEPGQQLYSLTIKLSEYKPPPPQAAVSTPSTTISNTGTDKAGPPPDPIGDAQQAQIANLLAKAAQP
jgi:hypothetical protein